MFFRGLDNASFPVKNDIFSLHDTEFARKISKHKDLEEGLLFYKAISGANRLFLTFPGIDDEGNDSSVSPYLKEIQNVVSTFFHTGLPGSAWEGGYVTERGRSENVIRALRDEGDSPVSLLSSLKIRNSELSEEIEHALYIHIKLDEDKNMPLQAEDSKKIIAELWGDNKIFSVTDLEMYNSCPIKFYLTRILGLKAKIHLVDGLDPAERGSIIHDILAGFYRTLLKRKGRTTFLRKELEYCTVLMQEIVEYVFHSETGTDSIKKQHPVVFGTEKRYIQRWMNYFLELEADCFENSPFQPGLFEVTFGDGSYPPLELVHEGKKTTVKGRIDRIDTMKDKGCSYSRVVDYKTGRKTTSNDIIEGKALQIPLYIKAVNENILPDMPVQSGFYYNLKYANYDKKKKQLNGCNVINNDLDEYMETACVKAVQAAFSIRSGLFPAPAEKCSEYCEWLQLCRGGRHSRGEVIDADI